MSDVYAKVSCGLETVTQDAFLIVSPFGNLEWVPFSLVKAFDERKIKEIGKAEKIIFSLREWKAIELGLI